MKSFGETGAALVHASRERSHHTTIVFIHSVSTGSALMERAQDPIGKGHA